MFFVILIQIEGHKFTSFCNYSVLPFLNKVYYYYYYYYYSYIQFSESIKHEGLRPWKMSASLLKSVCLFGFFRFWCIRNFFLKNDDDLWWDMNHFFQVCF